MSAAVERFFEACRLPEPKSGQKVSLQRYHNSAVRGVTHEVRDAEPHRLFHDGLFFGSEKQCVQFIAEKKLERLR